MPTCQECAKIWTEKCTYLNDFRQQILFPSDQACDDFQAKSKQKQSKTWKLALEKEAPKPLQPCGFFGDTIIESAWLPYEDENGKIEIRPSLIIKKENEPVQIKDFLSKDLGLNMIGTFPSSDLKTAMNVNAVKTLLQNDSLDAKVVDSEIEQAFLKHIEIGANRRTILKRWIEGTYFCDIFDAYPILNIFGVSESGKSRILKVVQALSYHACGVVDPTPASIFRMKSEDRVTLCMDEGEYLNDPNVNQIIRVLINASYTKGLSVPRYDEVDGKRVKRQFNIYSPFAICGISGLEAVTSSRAIRIVTERSKTDYPVARVEDYEGLRDKLYVLRFQKAFELKRVYDSLDISSIVSARFVELFKPIFVLTKLFGNDEEFNSLADWSSRYQDVFRAEASNIPEEEEVLKCLTQLAPLPDDWFSLKQLTDKVNLQTYRRYSYQKVGEILKRMGITERRRISGMTQFRASRDLLKQVASRLGLELQFEEKHVEETQRKIFLDKSSREW